MCNPTDGRFMLRKFEIEGYFNDVGFLDVELSRALDLEPHSLGMMEVEYTILQDWGQLIVPAMNSVVNSKLSQYGLKSDASVTAAGLAILGGKLKELS